MNYVFPASNQRNFRVSTWAATGQTPIIDVPSGYTIGAGGKIVKKGSPEDIFGEKPKFKFKDQLIKYGVIAMIGIIALNILRPK